MTHFIRTFQIRDSVSTADEAFLAEFLRSVEIQRIETAYSDGAWHLLVMYDELRRKEETAQIESAISAALNTWRAQLARQLGIDREAVLTDGAITEIARYAPTTAIELSVIASSMSCDLTEHGPAVVQVVRQTLEDLTS
ncbi:MAG: HRDC domain-containing protein [Azospirillaceae bacterium]|nr:HRDC domain-containing protein [Azospirillaceae bacterium]